MYIYICFVYTYIEWQPLFNWLMLEICNLGGLYWAHKPAEIYFIQIHTVPILNHGLVQIRIINPNFILQLNVMPFLGGRFYKKRLLHSL